jgi:hypothetical protein
MKGSISGIMGYAFFAIKPSSGRHACTSGHWTAKEIERDARDAAVFRYRERYEIKQSEEPLLVASFYT